MGAYDIAVAGCGPAGLAAALLLARDGHRVQLFERFETPRPMGSGLLVQPTGQAVLRKLGLEAALLHVGDRVERLFGRAASGRVVLNVHYDWLKGGHAGIGVHRAALFDILHGAVRAAGLPIETGVAISGSESVAGGRRLLFADGGASARFDLVVDALGLASTLAPLCGRPLAYGALWASLDWPTDGPFDAAALEQRYVAARKMVGVLPIGRLAPDAPRQAAFFWSLRADRLDAWRAAGLGPWKAEVASLWPETQVFLDQIHDPDQLTFARYAHRTLPAPAAPGLIHIGDAWHSTSPQLGQGANMALLDAWALAKALRETQKLDAALAAAVALRRDHVRLFQALSLLFTPAYQSDGRVLPFVRDRLVAPFITWWPATIIQADMVTGLMGNPLAALGLDN